MRIFVELELVESIGRDVIEECITHYLIENIMGRAIFLLSSDNCLVHVFYSKLIKLDVGLFELKSSKPNANIAICIQKRINKIVICKYE